MNKVKLNNIVTLLMLIGIACCSHISFMPGRVEMHNFTQKEQDDITQILKELNVNNKKGFVFEKIPLGGDTLGRAYNFILECYVELDPEIFTNDYFKSVIYHEIGHCFGLTHSPNPKDLMYFEVKFYNEYTPLQIETFLKQLNSCF